MKSWVRTGLISVVIYLAVFTLNFFFLRTLSDNMIMFSVHSSVYIILQMFGLVNPGIYIFVGVVFYFVLGVGVDYVEVAWDKIRNNRGQAGNI
jgi:hypothetical protein